MNPSPDELTTLRARLAEVTRELEEARRERGISFVVRIAIRAMKKNWGMPQIAEWMKENDFGYTRDQISFVLSRMARKGEIKLAKAPSGRRAALFNP